MADNKYQIQDVLHPISVILVGSYPVWYPGLLINEPFQLLLKSAVFFCCFLTPSVTLGTDTRLVCHNLLLLNLCCIFAFSYFLYLYLPSFLQSLLSDFLGEPFLNAMWTPLSLTLWTSAAVVEGCFFHTIRPLKWENKLFVLLLFYFIISVLCPDDWPVGCLASFSTWRLLKPESASHK